MLALTVATSDALILLGIIASAVTPSIALIVGYVLNRRERREVAAKVEAVKEDLHDGLETVQVKQEIAHAATALKLDAIQILVNGRMAEALAEIADQKGQLTAALTKISNLEALLLSERESRKPVPPHGP